MEWRPITNYESRYEVSNMGQVRSLNWKRTGEVRVLASLRLKNGYNSVGLHNEGQKTAYIHHLVANAFIPLEEGKDYIDHINRDKTDNRVENLRRVTNGQNIRNTADRTENRCNYALPQGRGWKVQVKVGNETAKHLGCFKDLDDARRVRDEFFTQLA